MPTELADGLGLRVAPLNFDLKIEIRPTSWFPRSSFHLMPETDFLVKDWIKLTYST